MFRAAQGSPAPGFPFPRQALAQGWGWGKSQSFFPLLQVLCTLQSLQSIPPACLLENVSMQFTPGLPSQDYNTICAAIGHPVLVDAARFGAGAHRVRNFWAELTDAYDL